MAHAEKNASLIERDDAVVVIEGHRLDAFVCTDNAGVVHQDRELTPLTLHTRDDVPPLLITRCIVLRRK